MSERTTIRRHQRKAAGRVMTVQPPPMTAQPQWLPSLLAVDAHDADHGGTCHHCGHAIRQGDRIAILMDGNLVHVALCAEASHTRTARGLTRCAARMG